MKGMLNEKIKIFSKFTISHTQLEKHIQMIKFHLYLHDEPKNLDLT